MEKNNNYEVSVFRCRVIKDKVDTNLVYKLEYNDNKNTIKDLLDHISEFSQYNLCPCFMKLSGKSPPEFDKNKKCKNLLELKETSLLSDLNANNNYITICY